MRNFVFFSTLVFFLLLCTACSNDMVNHGLTVIEPPNADERSYNGMFMGFYSIRFNPDYSSADVVPNRLLNAHINAEGYLSGWPCTNCLKVKNIQFLPDNIVECDIEVTHPVPYPQFTVFDLRVIAIFPEEESFDGKGVSYALLNRDGLTALWDNLSIPGDVNGYKAYNKGVPRRPFRPGDVLTEHFRVKLPPGPLRFDIGVDAGWEPNDGINFPIEMNSLEVIDLKGRITGGLTDNGGIAQISVSMYDYQGTDTILKVTAVCEKLFNAPLQLEYISGDANNATYGKTISNVKRAPAGIYNVLVRAIDEENLNYPEDISSYLVIPARVEPWFVEIALSEDDDYKTPGNYFNFYSYSGPADHNVINYFDTDGPWDFTSLGFTENAQKLILEPGNPEVDLFDDEFPGVEHFVKNYGNFGLGSGMYYQAEKHDYAMNELIPLGFYDEEHFGGAIVYDNTIDGFPYPMNINTDFSREYRSGYYVYVDYDVKAIGAGPCKIPKDEGNIEHALLVRTIVDFRVGFPVFKAIIYEWYDSEGNLLAVIASTNVAGRDPLWVEQTNEIIYGGIMAMYESNRN